MKEDFEGTQITSHKLTIERWQEKQERALYFILMQINNRVLDAGFLLSLGFHSGITTCLCTKFLLWQQGSSTAVFVSFFCMCSFFSAKTAISSTIRNGLDPGTQGIPQRIKIYAGLPRASLLSNLVPVKKLEIRSAICIHLHSLRSHRTQGLRLPPAYHVN